MHVTHTHTHTHTQTLSLSHSSPRGLQLAGSQVKIT